MGRIDVVLGLTQTGFQRGMERARGTVQKFGRVADRGLNVGRLLGAGAAVVGIDRMLDRLERLEDTAVRLQTSFGFVQELEGLADSVGGLQLDNLVEFLQDVNEKGLDAAKGSGEAAAAFEMMGLNADDFLQLGMRDQLLAIAEAVHSHADGHKASAAMMKIGSDEATRLLPLLRKGAENLEEMMRGVDKFGSGAAANLKAARVEMRAMNREFSNTATMGVGGLGLMLRGAGNVAGLAWRDLDNPQASMGDYLKAFTQPFQEAQDKQRQAEIDAHRAEVRGRKDRAAALEAQAEERLQKENEKAWEAEEKLLKEKRAFDEKIEKEFQAIEKEKLAAEKERVMRALEAQKAVAQEQAGATAQELAGLRRNRALQEVGVDELTALGLGAGGVNYALPQKRGEEHLRDVADHLEAIRGEVENFEGELKVEPDEFGGG